jgi:hypothetical protein
MMRISNINFLIILKELKKFNILNFLKNQIKYLSNAAQIVDFIK